ncbi:MAG TPA: PPOX class F420-dependent oxidoreductase [Actinophytocola sp.]|jgi:PPOX class probable F420-dependent enzyme|nr:PPOX class F420-dependent oxidoreductase [Actinophytocola sp.]
MEDRLLDLLSGAHGGVLATIKRDGRPQLSNVAYTFADGVIRVSITDGRAKTANLRRDPRASFHVTAPGFRGYVVAEGAAELTPVATAPDDATVDELVDVYRAISGEHPDWQEYRTAMVDDHRLVLRIPVDRVYGMA